jgi:hypothetical protein
MVVWLIWRMVREVRAVPGPLLFEKKAAVLASAMAPSMAKFSVAGLLRTAGSTPDSTRTPRMFPLRSTIAMIASLRVLATTARSSSCWASAGVTIAAIRAIQSRVFVGRGAGGAWEDRRQKAEIRRGGIEARVYLSA